MPFEFGQEVYIPAYDGRKTPMISYGLRFPEACAKHCQESFKSTRVYIICSKSLSSNTTALQRLHSALGDRVVGTRIGISPHTPIAEVVEIINDAKDLDVDCIVTLGAGSLTDGAKIVRLALANTVDTEEQLNTLWGTLESNPARREHIIKPTIPLIHIPTSLSGGEYQALAGGTESVGHTKRGFHCEGVDPELVIHDPELCLTTPQWVWLSTGIRAVDHCVETLCSLLSNDIADEWAARALPKLITCLLETKRDPSSLEPRRLCQQGVVEAMCAASSGVPLGGSHAIGHQLGPLGVGHGETSCILLPAVCKYNLAQGANVDRQAAVKELLLRQDQVRQLLTERQFALETVELGDILYVVISALEMPQSLEAVGVGEDKFATIAKRSLDDLWIRTNAVPITQESQVLEILSLCARN